jgi:hypothetical protein
VNDGGEDAPLTPRSRWIYHWIVGAIVVIGATLLLVLR